MLRTGDVIKTRIKSFPLIYHYGIIGENETGTNVFHLPANSTPKFESMEKFLDTRFIVEIKSGLSQFNFSQLHERFENVQNLKYSLLNFNCEDFVNYMLGCDFFNIARPHLLLLIIVFIFFWLYKG